MEVQQTCFLADASTFQSGKPTKVEAEVVGKVETRTTMGALLVTMFSYLYGNAVLVAVLDPDPRMDPWTLMKSPLPTLVMSQVYILMVTWLGPRLMRDRKPFDLRGPMMAYNAVQVAMSFYLFWEVGTAAWFYKYSWRCQPCDYSDNPDALRVANVCYWYYVSKLIDYFDTIFFVLHKKNNHISLLHVIHHSYMPISVWYGFKYMPGGHFTLFVFLNSFIHVVMYSYYLLAAMGPLVRQFLWWKKYVTKLQLIQFVMVLAHSAQLLFTDCDAMPIAVTRWVCGNALMFMILFADFYIKSYLGQRDKTKLK